MCSTQCACIDTYKSTWESLDESLLVSKDRTKTAAAGKIPLRFIAEEVVPEGQQPSEYTYNAFAECFYEWKSDWNGEAGVTPNQWDANAQEDFERLNEVFDTVDLVEFLWLSEGCHGICKTGIFSFGGVLEDGIPSLECQKVVEKRFKAVGPMILNWCLAASVVTLLAWFSHICLCFKFHKKDPMQKVKEKAEYKLVH